MHKTGTAQLVSITRWIAPNPKAQRGAALIWPKPDNMPPGIFNQKPGEGMSIAGIDIGQFIMNTVLGYQFGADSSQFDNAILISIGSPAFQKVYAILTSNQSLAQIAVSKPVDDLMTDWANSHFTPHPPQILIWDKGIEITIFGRVAEIEVLEQLAMLGHNVSKALQ
jgi:hypothetical protein